MYGGVGRLVAGRELFFMAKKRRVGSGVDRDMI